MRPIKFLYSLLLSLALGSAGLVLPGVEARAQVCPIDATFNPTDVGFGNGDGANSSVLASAVQADGKVLIVGNFTSYNGAARQRIARLNSDGTVDTGFNPGTGA